MASLLNLERRSGDQEELVVRWHDDGFLVLREFFGRAAMASLDAAAQRLWADEQRLISPRNLRCRYMDHHVTGERLFECLDPVVDIAPEMLCIAFDDRLLRCLADLYRAPACLFKDKLIFKPPGARGYPLHQDYISWPNFPTSFLTVLIPLDAATEENGCTVVYRGEHQRGLLTPADGKFHPLSRDRVNERNRVPLELQPGDVAVFSGLTPHESSPNTTNQPRRQLYLSYNSQLDGGDQRAAHYRHFHQWLHAKYPQPESGDWYFA